MKPEYVARFALRFWLRTGRQSWPTLRHMSRSLRMTQPELYEHASKDANIVRLVPEDGKRLLGDLKIVAVDKYASFAKAISNG